VNREQAERWVQEWIAQWNRRDLEAILGHYREDVVMRSPTSELLVGSTVVRGRKALAEYWKRAMAQVRTLKFTLERSVWEPERRVLVIAYESHVNERHRFACELFVFDEEYRVVETAAYLSGGVPPDYRNQE
jgi:ketosteroid isomerase-like protein